MPVSQNCHFCMSRLLDLTFSLNLCLYLCRYILPGQDSRKVSNNVN